MRSDAFDYTNDRNKTQSIAFKLFLKQYKNSKIV